MEEYFHFCASNHSFADFTNVLLVESGGPKGPDKFIHKINSQKFCALEENSIKIDTIHRASLNKTTCFLYPENQ